MLGQVFVTSDLAIELGPTFTGVISGKPKTMAFQNYQIGIGDIKGFDIMLTAGVEYLNKKGFVASARYNLGMSNLAANFKSKVSSLEVSVGYLFTLSK